MPQICCFFSDELFNEIDMRASMENTEARRSGVRKGS